MILAQAAPPKRRRGKAAGEVEPLAPVAADLVATVLGEGATVIRDVAAEELLGQPYRAPFGYAVPEGRAHYVVEAAFVTTTDGTGLVHMAPAFGAAGGPSRNEASTCNEQACRAGGAPAGGTGRAAESSAAR